MTTSQLPLLAVRTDTELKSYTPLSDAQYASLSAFYQRINDTGKFGSPSFSINEIAALVKQGLGSDALYLACRGESVDSKGHPGLAKMILVEDRTANPSLKDAEGISISDWAEQRAAINMGFDSKDVSAEIKKRVTATMPIATLSDGSAPVIAAAPPPVAVEAPVAAAAVPVTPSRLSVGGSIVARARTGMHNARAESATTPLRPLSEQAQDVLDEAIANQRQR